jgi:hypothetical protein
MQRLLNEGTVLTIKISLVAMEEKGKRTKGKEEGNTEQKTDEGMMVIHRWDSKEEKVKKE